MRQLNKTNNLVLTAVLTAIIIIMAFVPFLGYIPLGFMNATIIHIPVIVGAIILGPKSGAFLGLMFGLTSLWKNTMMPNPTSFVFSPFVEVAGFGGNLWSLVICIVPRIMIALVAYGIYRLFYKLIKDTKGTIPLILASIAGSLTNTLLVMNFIFLFFGDQYAAATNKAVEGFYYVIIGVIVLNGIPEAILAGFLATAITKILLHIKFAR